MTLPRARRSDARRNIDAILEAAMRLLPDHPRASMQEVADAAGVHRATVHRHFPSRDDLLTALRRRGLDQLQELVDDPALRELEPSAALDRLTTQSLRNGDRSRTYRIVPSYDEFSDARADALMGPLRELMERCQAAGDVRPDVDADVLVQTWGGLLLGTLPMIATGRLTLEQGAAHVRRMLAGS